MPNNTYDSYSDKELIRRWGDKIQTLRVEADMSQTDLSEKTGMSRSSIAGIEKGRNFSVASLISISRALNILDAFEFFLKDEEYELTPMEIYEREKNKKKRGGYNK
jgi:transcriptional regulator with XRE-family HTH domain